MTPTPLAHSCFARGAPTPIACAHFARGPFARGTPTPLANAHFAQGPLAHTLFDEPLHKALSHPLHTPVLHEWLPPPLHVPILHEAPLHEELPHPLHMPILHKNPLHTPTLHEAPLHEGPPSPCTLPPPGAARCWVRRPRPVTSSPGGGAWGARAGRWRRGAGTGSGQHRDPRGAPGIGGDQRGSAAACSQVRAGGLRGSSVGPPPAPLGAQLR